MNRYTLVPSNNLFHQGSATTKRLIKPLMDILLTFFLVPVSAWDDTEFNYSCSRRHFLILKYTPTDSTWGTTSTNAHNKYDSCLKVPDCRDIKSEWILPKSLNFLLTLMARFKFWRAVLGRGVKQESIPMSNSVTRNQKENLGWWISPSSKKLITRKFLSPDTWQDAP